MPIETVVVILAAGAGSRFDGPGHKLSAPLPADGGIAGTGRLGTGHEGPTTVIERALRHALAAGIGPVVVVTGAAPDIIPPAIVDHLVLRHNDRWADGQLTSLLVGMDAAAELGADSIVVGLADQPGIAPSDWRAVASSAGSIVVATYDGRRANPVKLDARALQLIRTLLPDTGDEGARALMRLRPELVREVPCIGSPDDIDTEEDLRRWQNS
jgi:molybdenum cofactor cytidylyltransferase